MDYIPIGNSKINRLASALTISNQILSESKIKSR